MKISLMITCLADVLRPEIGIATVNLLRRLGHEVEFPLAQTCCGQPMFNSGFSDLAREQAKHTIGVFDDSEVVVTPSGSCAAMLKVEYPELLHADDAWHRRAVALSERTFELSSFLVHRLGVIDVGAKFDGVVTYHYACHGRMTGATNEVERLLAGVAGLRYVPIAPAGSMLRLWRLVFRALPGDFDRNGQRQGELHLRDRCVGRRVNRHGLSDEHRRAAPTARNWGGG